VVTDYKPSAAEVKSLREMTGAGMMDVRNALVEAGGSVDEARRILREKGMAKANKLAGRTTTEGRVGAYVHGGNTKGVLVEVGCETDFVASNDKMGEFVKDLTLQIVSSENTRYVSVADVPEEVRQAELEVYRAQAADKPAAVQDKIAEGRLKKWYGEVVLLEQPYFRDESVTVDQHRAALAREMGENIEVKRFARYDVKAG
jgi:elongation factor Ts